MQIEQIEADTSQRLDDRNRLRPMRAAFGALARGTTPSKTELLRDLLGIPHLGGRAGRAIAHPARSVRSRPTVPGAASASPGFVLAAAETIAGSKIHRSEILEGFFDAYLLVALP